MELQLTHFQAGNPLSAAARLRELLNNGDRQTRLRLAENESSPPDVLKKLSKDEDPEVRAGVANNPSATQSTLKKMALDPHDDVRFAMASNPHLPLDILEKFSEDQNPYIRDRAHKTLDGLVLELDLAKQGFVCLPGANARLGDLLIASGLIKENEIEILVNYAKGARMPLGRAIVEAGRIDRSIVAYALKQQTLVRLGQLNLEGAIATIIEYTRRPQHLH